MKKLCYICKKHEAVEISKNGRILYYCPACKKTNERFFQLNDGNIYQEITENGLVKHTTVGAIIRKQDKILFLKRRAWPYAHAFPAGHLEYGESPEQALKREIVEELGLFVVKSKLLLHENLESKCRYGANVHEFYLFDCKLKNLSLFINSESEKAVWLSAEEAIKTGLAPTDKYLLNKILEDKKFYLNNSYNTKKPFPEKVGGNFESLTGKQNELIYHISQALFKVGDIKNILNVVAAEILNSLNIESIAIWLKDRNIQDELTLPAYRIKSKKVDFISKNNGKEIAKKTILDKKTITASIEKDDVVMAMPIISGGKILGVLEVRDDKSRYFSESELQLLTIISSQIGLAIENHNLYEQLNNRIAGLSKLFGITSITNKQTKQTIQKILDTIPELFEAEKTHFLVLDPKHKELGTFVHAGIENKEILLPINLKEDTFSTIVTKTQRPLITNNAEQEKRIHPKFKSTLDVRSLLSVPVLVSNRSLGVLHIINKFNNNFNDEDVKLASIVATRIGTKIENSELQERTESERNLLESVVSNINEGVIVTDKKNNIVVWNKYMERLTGFSGKYAEANRLKLAKTYAKFVLQLIRQPENSYREYELDTVPNSNLWLGVSVSFLRDKEGTIANKVFVFRNVSREHELTKAKNEFISTATHELRTPLTATKGYLSMTLSGDAGELNKKQERYLKRAYASTERLVELVEEILETLRIDENKITVEQKGFDLISLVKESVEDLSLKAKLKSINLGIRIGKNNILAYGDPIKSKHIIENLIDNAIKYTRNKGKISVSVLQEGDRALLSIKDNGVGIAKENQGRIFKRFTRINNPLSIEAGGTGLGLYIAKELINKQGGDIWVESKLGKGSNFRFTIPTLNN